MLRKFKITVDGKEYLVEMEEIGGAPVPVMPTPSPMPTAAAAQETPPTHAPTPATSSPAGQNAMSSPMPGVILKLLVQVGESVSENQPLMILEAMKMENEIVAGTSGTVTGIHVTQGQNVNAGDALITIE